jgi:hypothetical protein
MKPEWMPKPTPEHERLCKAMAGNWTSKERIFPSPWDAVGGEAIGRSQARAAVGGFFVVADYEQERGGAVNYHGHGVYGYDAEKKRYSMQWCDDMGGTPANLVWGDWVGDTLTFQSDACGGGKARYVYRFDTNGEYVFSILMSQDGSNWAPFMEGRFVRQQR